MPLVLATGAATESGHSYADVLGDSYEYPVQYRSRVTPGEVFVYYRGARDPGGGRRPAVYLGSGMVGPVRSSTEPGRLVCVVEKFVPFDPPLPFRDPVGGGYLEAAGRRKGYWQPGVRTITIEEWERIVQLGLADSHA